MEEHKKEKVIHYKVGKTEEETDKKFLTPREILEDAGIDQETNYLIQVKGKEQISYKDNPTEEIEMHNGMRFISISTGPTQVS